MCKETLVQILGNLFRPGLFVDIWNGIPGQTPVNFYVYIESIAALSAIGWIGLEKWELLGAITFTKQLLPDQVVVYQSPS